jgi:hypothetical protein
MPLPYAERRADVAYIISEDPWDLTVYRRSMPAGGAETKFTAVGRVQPVGSRTGWGVSKPALEAEQLVGTAWWLILLPWNATPINVRDEVTAVNRFSGLTHRLKITAEYRYTWKMEVVGVATS